MTNAMYFAFGFFCGAAAGGVLAFALCELYGYRRRGDSSGGDRAQVATQGTLDAAPPGQRAAR